MSYKTALKGLLLIFVVISLGFLTIKESHKRSDSVSAADPAPAEAAPAGNVTVRSDAPERPARSRKIVAYYFHVTYRCPTCQTIEALSEEALRLGFADALKDGTLEWHPVNVQLPENRHFIQDYQLFTKSLIIARMKDGRQVEWKNLEKVWELVWNRQAFLAYVQDEVRAFLERE
ncbi:MAG: hypothetical protein HXY20_05245 [Acidobacteria bacterium]|nr:hypothetical protein [Acidobacteriota bacterium]